MADAGAWNGSTTASGRIHALRLTRRRGIVGACVAVGVALCGVGAGVASAADVPSSLVNTIQTSAWVPPSPDPSGIAYDPVSNRLIVTDGEVDEMPIYAGANYYESTLGGSLLRTATTFAFSKEPTGVALGVAGELFMTNDDQARVQQITLGANGRFDGSDSFRFFSTTQYGTIDAEGVAYDATGNRLYIADGSNGEIWQITPVDGVFGNGNDTAQHFDTAVLGVSDPETVEFDPDTKTLYTLSTQGKKVLELTTAGALLRTIDISYLPPHAWAGITLAPRSNNPALKSLYIADRAVDNNDVPTENDGKIYEIAIGGLPPQPPEATVEVKVSAGSDDAEEFPSGRVNTTDGDLEMVTDGTLIDKVGVRFKGVSIPPGATITNAYIQFVADESQSEATALTIQAEANDDSATYSSAVRGDVSARPRTSAAASWSVAPWMVKGAGLAQRTPNLAALVQEVVSRPGWARGNALAFAITGSGQRTAEPFEGNPDKMPLLHIEYR